MNKYDLDTNKFQKLTQSIDEKSNKTEPGKNSSDDMYLGKFKLLMRTENSSTSNSMIKSAHIFT